MSLNGLRFQSSRRIMADLCSHDEFIQINDAAEGAWNYNRWWLGDRNKNLLRSFVPIVGAGIGGEYELQMRVSSGGWRVVASHRRYHNSTRAASCRTRGFGGPDTYEITNLKSEKVLDLDRNDQTSVMQFSASGTDNQAWSIRPAEGGYYVLRNIMNGYALEAPGNENSTPVVARPFNGGPNQQWRFERGKDGNALITSLLGKILDVPGGTGRDGARLQIYESNGDFNQRFTLRPVSGNWPARWDMAPGSAINCSSEDSGRHYCYADTHGGVRIVRQISGSPCEFNVAWGFDPQGIWVDRGCRAEFETGVISGYGAGPPPPSPARPTMVRNTIALLTPDAACSCSARSAARPAK